MSSSFFRAALFAWATFFSALSFGAEPVFLEKDVESPAASGLMVVQTIPESQAQKAGLKPGDIALAYAGEPLTESTALSQSVHKHEKDTSELTLTFLRDGKEESVKLKPGRIGMRTAKVEKGKPYHLRPPQTEPAFDYSLIEKEPLNTWYSFYIRGKQVGFEHNVTTYDTKTQELTYLSEVAFDVPEYPPQHFLVEAKVKAVKNAFPTFLGSTFAFPISGWKQVCPPPVNGKFTFDEIGKEDGKDVKESRELTATPDLMHDYMAHGITQFMPRKPGACFHYTQLDGMGVNGPAAMVAVGEEEVDVLGEKKKLFKIDKVYVGDKAASRWVDEKGVIICSFYGNETYAYFTTKEKALENLSSKIKPVTAK